MLVTALKQGLRLLLLAEMRFELARQSPFERDFQVQSPPEISRATF
jgi:hypothetical protein